MREYGGFEHNLQSLRVVDTLEERYAEFNGLNLTFETREGILKHCSVKVAAGLGELGRRFTEKRQPSLEAQLVNLADEIAYNNHDVDDGLRSGLLRMETLRDIRLFAEQHEAVLARYPDIGPRRIVHETIRRMIGRVVGDVISESRRRIAAAGISDIESVRRQPQALIGYSPAVVEQTRELKRFLRQHLYAHERVQRVTEQSAKVIQDLFIAYQGEPRRLPPQYQDRLAVAGTDKTGQARVIADYIAGMTDRYALAEHARLAGTALAD
jgi:dGTPase